MKTAQMTSEATSTWQRAISRGQAETSMDCYGNAILLFNQALDQALYSFSDLAQQSVDRAISQVLIAKFSLADCYQPLGMTERAAECYISAAEFLARTHDARLDKAELATAIMHAFHHCNVLWMQFLASHRDVVSVASKNKYSALAKQIMQREIELNICH